MTQKISRRGFINRYAKGAAGIFMIPFTQKAFGKNATMPLAKSRVVVVKHDNALNGTAFNQEVIQVMMNSGITTFTGIADVGEAWKSLFPGITKSSIISIKINCLFPAMSTHPPVTEILLNSLRRMMVDESPFPENNIILWDNWNANIRNAGFKINTSSTGVRCFGTEGSYDSTSYKIDGGVSQRLSKILTEGCHYLMNFNVLKNHWTSGISLSMKNHYGSISAVDGSGMHDNYAELPISSINALKPIRDKQVICICDAIKGTIRGGPSAAPQVAPKCLIFATDPVAHDYIGTQMLKDYGCSSNDTSLTGAARHIAAAASRYNLGTCDPAQIEKIEVNNPSESPSGVGMDQSGQTPDVFLLSQNYPNPFNSRTFIPYQLPKSTFVRARIMNMKGQLVRRLFEGRQGPGFVHADWDGIGADGSQVPSGMYLCVVEANDERQTVKMQLIR
jgi:hypothetical protein